MAGHSQFANIKHRKEAQDRKKAGKFTKLVREITVAAKLHGGDPNYNPRLRSAIIAARAINMPKDRIEVAIKKGTSAGEGENFDEMRYEGYAPGGVALIIEVLTDNKNRSASDVRSILSKNGGSLGESGSVAFMFDRVGLIRYPLAAATPDAMLEAAIEVGANDCQSDSAFHEVTCEPDDLNTVRDGLQKKFGDPEAARLDWKPKNIIEMDNVEQAKAVIELIDLLEENDDVQHVHSNFRVADSIAGKL